MMRFQFHSRMVSLGLIFGWLCTASSPAQTPDKPIHVDVSLVLVNVSLFDRAQRPIVNFRKEDLRIFEDRVSQQIIYFGKDDLPLNLALVVDVSGSVIPVLPQIKAAANEALSTLKPDDAVALFEFSRRVRKIVDYTTQHGRIVEAIARLQAGGGTALNDALFYSARSLKKLEHERRRVIVMISDNEGMPLNDHSQKEAIQEAQEAGAVVYGIKVKGQGSKLQWLIPTGILSKKLAKAFRKPGDMKKYASETGGALIKAEKPAGIHRAFQQLMEQVAAQHYVGYISSNSLQDGALRKVDVRLSKTGRKRLGKVKIRHRRAYLAPSPH